MYIIYEFRCDWMPRILELFGRSPPTTSLTNISKIFVAHLRLALFP